MQSSQYIAPTQELQQDSGIRIDVSAIPDFRRKELARCVLDSLERALSVPGAEAEFQEWLKGYRERKLKAAHTPLEDGRPV